MKTAIAWILVFLVVSIAILPHSFVQAKSKDSKAKDAIVKAMGKAVEGKYAAIDQVNISKFNDSSTLTIYNKNTSPGPVTPPPNPPPNPPPTPVGDVSKACIVGDLSGSTIPNLMKNCVYNIGLGDLGYKSDLSYFKGLNFNKCLQGNHESANEDGTASIEKETQAYCGDSWYIKTGKAALIFGFNTNGDLTNQLNAASKILLNTQSMQGIKTVIILSHKPCYTNPNAHHPVESNVKAFCDKLQANIPQGIKTIYIAGHNHVLSSTVDQTKFTAGGGGRSHYSCGTDTVWNFCDAKNYGYLELTIDNTNGATAAKFIK